MKTHAGRLFVGFVALALGVTCGDGGLEVAVESSSGALAAGTVLTFEAEVLARTASATGSQVTSEAGASGGQYVQLSGTPAAGAFIEFTLPNVPAGGYDVKVLYKANFNRGIVQASIGGVNQGSPCDQYAATATQQKACALGSKTLTADSSPIIRFTVTGKNASSAGFMMVIDQISLTATGGSGTGGTTGGGGSTGRGGSGGTAGSGGATGTSVTYEAEVLTRAASATGSQVTSEAGASGGQYVQLSGTPAAGACDRIHAAECRRRHLRREGAAQGQLQPRNRSGEHRRGQPGSPLQSVRGDRHAAGGVQPGEQDADRGQPHDSLHRDRQECEQHRVHDGHRPDIADGVRRQRARLGGDVVGGAAIDGVDEPAAGVALEQHPAPGRSRLGGGKPVAGALLERVRQRFRDHQRRPRRPVATRIPSTAPSTRRPTGRSPSRGRVRHHRSRPGALVRPGDFALAPLSNLSVTVAFGGTPSNVTGHPGSRTTSYLQSASSNVSAATMTSALTTDHWYILSGVDAMTDARAIVVLGDSITDGRGSTTNGNNRWPDTPCPATAGKRRHEGRGLEPGHRRQRGHQRRPGPDRVEPVQPGHPRTERGPVGRSSSKASTTSARASPPPH